MALTEYGQFFSKWFGDATPKNAKKATGTLTISGVVSDAQIVTVGSKTYEFDIDNTITAGRIKVDIADLRNQATGTLTFTGVPVAAETVTVGTEVYELVAAAEDIAVPTNIPVVLGVTLTADNAVTKLAEAISANSAIVDAVGNTTADTVVLVADVKGTAGNSIDTTTTCSNATFGGANLSGGLDTITAPNAVTALVTAITVNDTSVVAADGAGDTVVVTYGVVGTEGNSIVTTKTMTNGLWAAATLTGGQYATPFKASAGFIIISGTWYICTKPCDKYTTDAWYSASPTIIS